MPFIAASRQMSQPQPVPAQPVQQQAEPQPVRQANEPPAARAPIDVVPVPTRLIPPAIPRVQQQGDDTAAQALTEISDAARRVDERHAGVNQQLRAINAPAAKSTP